MGDDEIETAIKTATATMINYQALCLAIADDKDYKFEKYRRQILQQMKEGNVKDNGEPFVHNSFSLQLGQY